MSMCNKTATALRLFASQWNTNRITPNKTKQSKANNYFLIKWTWKHNQKPIFFSLDEHSYFTIHIIRYHQSFHKIVSENEIFSITFDVPTNVRLAFQFDYIKRWTLQWIIKWARYTGNNMNLRGNCQHLDAFLYKMSSIISFVRT